MENCGKHCETLMTHGNLCILVRGHGGAHVSGGFPCESGLRFRYVSMEVACMYPPCGFEGIMTAEEVIASLAVMGYEGELKTRRKRP